MNRVVDLFVCVNTRCNEPSEVLMFTSRSASVYCSSCIHLLERVDEKIMKMNGGAILVEDGLSEESQAA